VNSDTIQVLGTQEDSRHQMVHNQQSHKRKSTETSVAGGSLLADIAQKYTSARMANEESKTLTNRDGLSTTRSRGRVDSMYKDTNSQTSRSQVRSRIYDHIHAPPDYTPKGKVCAHKDSTQTEKKEAMEAFLDPATIMGLTLLRDELVNRHKEKADLEALV